MEEKEVTPETQVEVPVEPEEPHLNLDDLLGLVDDDTAETVGIKVQEKLGLTMETIKEALSKATIERAEEFTLEFPNIAPMGDYEKLIEDNDGMAEFLKNEAHKPEHWKLVGLKISDVKKDLISFIFANMAVDDGTTFKGFVFVSTTGKIKHAFAQVEE